MSIARSFNLAILVCVIGLLCGGCVSRVAKASYPESWSQVKATPAAQCPNLSGRYVNAGEAAAGTKSYLCSSQHNYRGTWCGDTALSKNIAEVSSGDWVELRQPDEDTLVVISSDPTVPVQELRHTKGDFSCSANGLERKLHASVASSGDNSRQASAGRDIFNSFVTVGGAMMYASGGVRTLTQRFSRADDGSLVMSVSQVEAGAMLLIPYREREESFVRWTPVVAVANASAANPIARESTMAPVDLPSNHVGIFESTNGSLWSQVKVTNLDGSPANTEARYPGVPIAMQPGRHWVQVGAPTTHMMPLRDVDTKYAFELEVVAGHRYRIPKRPPSCLAPGKIDAALASSNIYHTRLSVSDEAPGGTANSIEVDALCVSVETYVCPVADGAGSQASDSGCVALAGWPRGYNGHDAGPVPPQ